MNYELWSNCKHNSKCFDSLFFLFTQPNIFLQTHSSPFLFQWLRKTTFDLRSEHFSQKCNGV